MKSRSVPREPSPEYIPKQYWTGLADDFESSDATGLAPVLHPDAPAWFNRVIDTLQVRAFERALAMADIPSGARVLDVGCGTGRWIRRYEKLGFHAMGVDATPSMLRVAREQHTVPPLIAGEAYRLPLPDAAFDCVSDITVTQHIPVALQPAALAEMMRVIRPGGHLILMELIRGKGVHIFPRSPQDWIAQASSCGAKLVGWFGQEYLLLDRLFVRVAQKVAGKNGGRAMKGGISEERSAGHSTVARRIYWRIRGVTVPLSAWIDPASARICPAHLATHGVFVFRK